MESLFSIISQGLIIAIAFYAFDYLIHLSQSFFGKTLKFESLDDYKAWIDNLEEQLRVHKDNYKEKIRVEKEK